jgi:hypothetical protein
MILRMKPEDYSEWSFPQLLARMDELLKQVRETDAQGLPVDELLTECNRAMSIMDLWAETKQGTEFYAGWWRSRQIKDEPPVLPPGERPAAQRIDVPKRAGRLGELARRRKHLKEHDKTSAGDEELLARQLDELGMAAGEPDVRFNELWEQHEFHWLAHTAELRRSITRQCAHIMLAFEDIERTDPHHFDDQPDMLKMFRWWREEGGREEYLGQITLEERRQLEEMARQWREKNP